MGMRMQWLVATMVLLAASGCNQNAPKSEGTSASAGGDKGAQAPAKPAKGPVTELKKIDTVPGKGDGAKPGDLLVVEYTGTFADGSVFDSNKESGNPFSLTLGVSSVIEGWTKGLEGIKRGGERDLEIPWSMGYGAQGSPPKIGAKTDLFFHVKVVDLIKKGEEATVLVESEKEGKGAAVKTGDKVAVTYVGTLGNGKKFDSTEDHGGAPIEFKVGSNEVVSGFSTAVMGMKVGGERKVIIPPMLAYGDQAKPGLPPGSILHFDLKLVKIN